MAARAGMATLIIELRGMTGVGTADTVIAGTTWYTDDQLEDILDRHRDTCYDVSLIKDPVTIGGTLLYKDYLIPGNDHWFETDAAASVWQVKDSVGGTASIPSHSVNYPDRRITFAATTGGTAYNIDYRRYDLNRAAADVWEQRATHTAAVTDWSSDNHSVKAQNVIDNFNRMAGDFRAKAGPVFREFVRADE